MEKSTKKPESKEYHVPALEKGLAILEYLVETGGKNLNQICKALGISRTTTFSTLKNFVETGYLQQKGDGSYYPTLKLFSMGMRVQKQEHISELVLTNLYDLQAEAQHTVHFLTYVGHNSVLLNKLDGPGVVQFLSFVGEMKPLHLSGAGKAILAYIPQEKFDAYFFLALESRTKNTISSREGLTKCREQIRKLGYSIDDEEGEKGVFCIGAPVFATDGCIFGAISVSMLKSVSIDGIFKRNVECVLRTAEKISRKLGYTGPYPKPDCSDNTDKDDKQ